MKTEKPLIIQIPIEKLQRGRYQPRRQFDQQALAELADSIRINGLIQPIVVRPIKNSPDNYEIIAGERRWRATQLAGLAEVSCLVRTYTDEQAAAVTAIENMQREDLNPIEEAQALQRLIQEFHYLHEEVAAVMSISRTAVTNALRLLSLENSVQQLLINGKLSAGHGKMLAALDPAQQLSLSQATVEKNWSVRKLEQMIKQQKTSGQNHRPDPNLHHLERAISDQLGAKVALETEADNQSGWLKIKFYDNQTLSGVLARMGIDSEEFKH